MNLNGLIIRINYNSFINFIFNWIMIINQIFIHFSCQDGETQRDIKLSKEFLKEKGDSIPDPTELVVDGKQLSIFGPDWDSNLALVHRSWLYIFLPSRYIVSWSSDQPLHVTDRFTPAMKKNIGCCIIKGNYHLRGRNVTIRPVQSL